MADKSPRQALSKKSGQSSRQSAGKKAKKGRDPGTCSRRKSYRPYRPRWSHDQVQRCFAADRGLVAITTGIRPVGPRFRRVNPMQRSSISLQPGASYRNAISLHPLRVPDRFLHSPPALDLNAALEGCHARAIG